VRSRLIGVLAVYNKKHDGLFREEDQRLLSIIAAQSAQIIENARLYEEERSLIRMREELRVAERIQAGLLPEKPPFVEGYELAGMSLPAQNVGGDYFDYLVVDSTHVAVCVADVSGKGLPASLLMSNVQAALRSRVTAGESPADFLTAVNGLLRRSMNRGSFVTMVYGILDSESHRFTFANAGHNRPLLKRSDGSVERLQTAGLALGLVPEPVYPLDSITLDRGDELLLYSDGITEAMNAGGEEWGEERLRSFLSERLSTAADELLGELTATVGGHRASMQQQDDMTLVLVRRR
jgi:sigma-B regulation protein RsbU (phosphoserine phosphatase)